MEIIEYVKDFDPLYLAILGGIFLASMNVLGATSVFVVKNISSRIINASLGLAAGVMLAASFTSLIIPATEMSGFLPVSVGLGLGGLFIFLGDRWVGKAGVHSYSPTHKFSPRQMHGIMLFVFAITLHNLPEGLAVGVGFGAENIANALVLMFAIGIQNIPEGLAVSFSLLSTEKYSRRKSFFYGFLSGGVEIPLAIIGAIWVSVFSTLLPYAMGFAAGAMVFVIAHEIIPETRKEKTSSLPTVMLMIGLIVMLILDVSLG
ncbi:ZIP family metal transporter [Nitrosopumilus sp. K4]|uniref:ZIP family metal transporter n=1 Tax=Nitrosopumilus sp. K4 TaxID=2795383 RepID=UPI001BA61E25|nr:ZIP family metal transporter [Nitrosopumilus sp. K4]QUC64135.1 ZIP family metal transporter [Nitrosopumilus sp. K4]